jgi:hypothetical protein
MSAAERLMLGVFILITVLWGTNAWHGIDYAVVAMLAVTALLATRVLDWTDVLSDRTAWDVFIWYGGVYQLARALAGTGITNLFAANIGAMMGGWEWVVVLVVLLLVYFYAHYGFASITAHASAMFVPFLLVPLARLSHHPHRVAHSLRDHEHADLLRCRLCLAADLVEARADRVGHQHPDLGDRRNGLVEGPRMVLSAVSRLVLRRCRRARRRRWHRVPASFSAHP